ncbi:hypothetical protein [Aquimarina sediminis]|uniref:hypothetical protein n=1 Tax=Aquimarina sediminis TaxID=2070536 RepID=UPI000CA022AF|nr:hypothetical protein [Aquimarina sediminis]
MKKQILNLGKTLSKTQQKEIFGGGIPITHEGDPCWGDNETGSTPSGCPCSQGSQCASSTCYSPGAGAVSVCY